MPALSPLEAAILVALKIAAPPGKAAWTLEKEAFSVEPVPASECSFYADACPGARRSSFYGAWVRRESKETGEARYAEQARALALELEGSPNAAAEAALVVAIAVNESGLREDVQFGRGRSQRFKGQKQHDGAGGFGRGPGNEACWMQILPSMAEAYGGPEALLEDSEEARRRCFRAALAQLRHARAICSSEKKRTRPTPVGTETVSRLYATVSLYGTGTSCASSNAGKTEARVKTYGWVRYVIDRELRHAASAG